MKITKKELANAIGVSRPTLDNYLNGKCPKDINIMINTQIKLYDLYDTRLRLENEIKLIDEKINKLKN